MKRALALAIFCFLRCMPAWLGPTQVLIFSNANVYTGDERQPRAEAIAVKGDRITFVGSTREAQRFIAETTRVIDLHGQTVLPGLTDSHCHIFGIGEREMRLNLEGINSREDFLAMVRERVDKTGPGKWITGRGWIETFWKPPQFPTRQDLDKIAPNNPVFLTRADGHASIANSAALKIARIDRNTPDPFGGQILKKNGEPNGMLLDNAQDLVARNIPRPTEGEREEALLRGIDREVKLGWCEVQNAGSHKEDVDLIRKAFETGKTKIRFVNAVLRSRCGRRRISCAKDPPLTRSITISRSARSKCSSTARSALVARRY